MPRRSTQSPAKSAFLPTSDQATYRDLLLFEERLKTNALSLNRRKSRYQLFLFQLIAVIVLLLCEVTLQTSFLSILYRILLTKALPHLHSHDSDAQLHPYVASGLLLVAVTTLVLFFASGMYAEKIGYANRYVSHANRSLRNFNMYLNMRKAPRTAPLNPLTYLFPRPTTSAAPSPAPSPPRTPPRTPSPFHMGKRSSSTVPIPSIPPASNPRGELIFSSRVDRSFRDAYERYRSAFERKRDERERLLAARTWPGWLWLKMPWNRPPANAMPADSPTPTHLRSGSLTARGRGGHASGATPNLSRRTTPVSLSPNATQDRGRSTSPVAHRPPAERGVGYM